MAFAAAAALIIPLITGGIVYYAGKGASYSQIIERLNYDFKIKTKLSLSGLDINIDFWLDNPTNKQLTISFPLVMLYYDTTWVAQNSVTSQIYTLKPKSQLTIPSLSFHISLFKVAKLIAIDFDSLTNAINNRDFTKYIEIIEQKLTQTASFEVDGTPLTYKSSLLGYAPLSAIDRPITNAPYFDYLFPMPKGETQLVVENGSVKDTVAQMHKVVNKDYKLLTRASTTLFNKKTVYRTSKEIFEWIFKHIKYNLEKGEQLRNPAVTYHLGQRLARKFHQENGYYSPEYSADCDDIAIFVASILKNLGIRYAFRIASYTSNGAYSHVYVIAFDENGNQIIIDPVYHTFNAEQKYTLQTTYDNQMAILSGVPVLYLSGQQQELDKAFYRFLVDSRNFIAKRPRHFRSSGILVQLYDYVIKYWNTKSRLKALKIVSQKELELSNQLTQNCPQFKNQNLFFNDLKGLYEYDLNGFKDWTRKAVAKAAEKAKSIVKKNYANKTTETLPQITPPTDDVVIKDNNDVESTKKTARDIFVKYKTPIAIGTAGLTLATIIAVSPKIQTQLGLRKKETIS